MAELVLCLFLCAVIQLWPFKNPSRHLCDGSLGAERAGYQVNCPSSHSFFFLLELMARFNISLSLLNLLPYVLFEYPSPTMPQERTTLGPLVEKWQYPNRCRNVFMGCTTCSKAWQAQKCGDEDAEIVSPLECHGIFAQN